MAFTYFLRDLQTLELVIKHLVPCISGRSRIRIWDAGCAMGQEPYSLAMLLAEHMGHFLFNNLRIYATDVDECDSFGEIVSAGEYHEDDIKRMPEDLRKKYFQPDDTPGCSKISEILREHVFFQKHDLLSLEPIGDGFSLIMCKNVLLHFQPEERIEVIKMFHRSLAPDGLFATEQTQKLPERTAFLFEQVTPGAQIFRKAGDHAGN